jgi:hypothetical protein
MGDLAFGRRRAVSRHPRRVGGELGVQIAVQAGQRVSIASGRYIVAGSARIGSRRSRAREISEDVMGPYTAIFGVLVFVIVVAGIGAVDILSSRRQARRQGGSEPRPLPSQPRAPAK